MRKLWESLERLRSIADTVRAEDIEASPETVRVQYEPYAEAYFVLESVNRVKDRLISQIKSGRSVTGYISADFGYGKTTTAIYLWKQCLDNRIVAVPPFLFRRLKDIMQGIKGWLAYELRRSKPELLESLEKTYQKYAQQSIEKISEEIATRKHISKEKVRDIVNEYFAPRQDFTTVDSLLSFLEEATKFALEAGYKGIVIFPDESQEFLRTEEGGAREAIQTLSELIKGIRAMPSCPFGIILTMPVSPTETAIEEQAGDIMHRMREQGVFLRLEDVYGSDFPTQLWEHLEQVFSDSEAHNAIEKRTLEALGQLCERKDLSNGPRTVINAFKRVAHHYQTHRKPYTPLNLIDDYLQGHIVFEGRGSRITATLHQLLELSPVKDSPEHQQAVKLLAAFPRGVDQSKAGHLYSTIQDLSDKERWLGQYITQLAEGYALVALQERSEARPLMDEILREFRYKWHHIWNENQKSKFALDAFRDDIIPLLFPKRTQGQYSNFGYKGFFEEKRPSYYSTLMEGCYDRINSRFPNRKILVSIIINHNNNNNTLDSGYLEGEANSDFDIHLQLFLEWAKEASQPNRIDTAMRARRIGFYFNLNRTFGRSFPAELNFLRDIMSPELTSVKVLLAISAFGRAWLSSNSDISEADRATIDNSLRLIHRYVLRLILPDARDPGSIEVQGLSNLSGAEQKLMESVFEQKCAELYPDYITLIKSKEWKTYLTRYKRALGKYPLAERRGLQPVEGTKETIAKAFDYSHTGFESMARNFKDMHLLDLQDWEGRGASSKARMTFKEHPLEKILIDYLRKEGQIRKVKTKIGYKDVKEIKIDPLKSLVRKKGYLPEEVEEALELLRLRQYIIIEKDTIHEATDLPDAQELHYQIKDLRTQIDKLAEYFPDDVKNLGKLLDEALETLNSSPKEDEVALDAAHRKIEQIKALLEQLVELKTKDADKQFETMYSDLECYYAEIQRHDPKDPVEGSVGFVTRIDDLRKSIEQESRKLINKCTDLKDKVKNYKDKVKNYKEKSDIDFLISALKQLREYQIQKDSLSNQIEEWKKHVKALEKWRTIVSKATKLRNKINQKAPLYQELNEKLTDSILDHLGSRGLEGLQDWEQFKMKIDKIEADLNAEENHRRSEFQTCKEEYEKIIGSLVPDRMIQAVYDPQDPEISYRFLYEQVQQKIDAWFREWREALDKCIHDLEYLLNEREIDLREDIERARALSDRLNELAQELDLNLVKDIDLFQNYCNSLKDIINSIKKFNRQKSKPKAFSHGG